MPTRDGRKAPQPLRSHWGFQTNATEEFVGGFYEFAGAADNFSPAIMWGTALVPKAAHLSLVVGAVPGDEVEVTISGVSIDDDGVRNGADTEIITIPISTPIDTYFETVKKWNGEITIETTSGTPILCNYFWSKYWDRANSNFTVSGLEALWDSDDSGSGSDIELLHHKATGWTYNAAAPADPPTAIAQRSVDHGAENDHEVGPGAWKRTNLTTRILGRESEGLLFRITSANTGGGTLSFRTLNLELNLS